MAKLLLTTTGTFSPVVITDLGGRIFTHPTIALDLLLEYKHSEIIGSSDLNAAVASGFITLTDAAGVAFPVVEDLAPIKDNVAAVVPTVTDDADSGYSSNSLWVKTTPPAQLFFCQDPAPGAAIWDEIILASAEDLLRNVKLITTNYTALVTDEFILADASSGPLTITLPDAVANPKLNFIIKKVDSTGKIVTVQPAGSDTVENKSDLGINKKNVSYSIAPLGTNWYIY